MARRQESLDQWDWELPRWQPDQRRSCAWDQLSCQQPWRMNRPDPNAHTAAHGAVVAVLSCCTTLFDLFELCV